MSYAIADYHLYVSKLPLDLNAKYLLVGLISIKLKGNVACPGVKTMATWLGKSVRTVERSMQQLIEGEYITKIRRGKKLTNMYSIGKSLWLRILAGMDKVHEKWTKFKEKVWPSKEQPRGYVQPYHPPAPKPERTVVSTMEHSAALDFLETNYEEAIKPI